MFTFTIQCFILSGMHIDKKKFYYGQYQTCGQIIDITYLYKALSPRYTLENFKMLPNE